MRMVLSGLAAVLAMGVAGEVRGDWPEFLGPNRDAVSTETGLLEQWPEDGLRELWRVDTGRGFGGPAVRDGRVYLLDRQGARQDVLRVFDIETGEELWDFSYTREGRLSHEGSRSTPTVDDELVFVVGGFGDVHAVERETGEPVWRLNLEERYAETRLGWGFAQSPLVYEDLLILSPPHPESPGLVAVNKETGETVWESEAFGGDYYSSPIVRTVHGVEGVLMITNRAVTFVEPESGETIWQYEGYSNQYPIPAPTVLEDGERIFITGGYEDGSVMIRVTESGGEYGFEEVFRLEGGAQLHPAIEHEGYLYLNLNENATLRRNTMRHGGLACIDPDEGIVWRTGAEPNFDRGHVMMADGKLIVLDGQNGQLHLVEPSPEGYEEISRVQVFEYDRPRSNNTWAPMALSDGLLVLRDQNEMVCVDIGG